MGPREERKRQVDGGRIERIRRMVEFDAEWILGVELAPNGDQAVREVVVDAPIAFLVGLRQGAAGNMTTDAEVIEFGLMRA